MGQKSTRAALGFMLCGLLVTPCANVRAAAPALQLERTIPLPKVTGRIDHMAIVYDPAAISVIADDVATTGVSS